MSEKTLGRLSRAFLGIAAFCHATGACAYALVQPRGFAVFSTAFFEHELLGPLVFVLALVLGFAVAKRRESLAAGVASAFSGFWVVVAGYGFFAGTTFFARLLALPIAASLFLFLLAYRTRRQALVLGLPLGAGVLVGAAFWASAIAPRASTSPLGKAPKSGPIPEAAPALDDERLSARVEGTSIFVDAGASHAEIVPSFDYTSVAEHCGLSVLEFRSAALPPYRAGRQGNKLFFAADNADFQTYGEISIERGRAARIEVSTTVRRELCAHRSHDQLRGHRGDRRTQLAVGGAGA